MTLRAIKNSTLFDDYTYLYIKSRQVVLLFRYSI